MRPERTLALKLVAGLIGLGAAILLAASVLSSGYDYHTPAARPDGLAVADAANLGLDTARIAKAVRSIRAGEYGKQTSLLVLKDGRLVVEEYFDDGGPDERRGVQSVSKSITSLLVGYGLAHHYIASVDDPIAKYLPKYGNLLTEGKEKITIRHLLTMTSGLDWDEWNPPYGEPDNIRERERNSDDAVAFVLGRRLSSQPGETWSYDGGGMTVLGEILTHASGLSPRVLVERAFDGMLSDSEIEPTLQRDGRLNAAGGFMLTPRGMAKIGQMILQRGTWNGTALFDPAWIRESVEPTTRWRRLGYGYLWWRHRISVGGRDVDAIAADGYGGQHIVAFPDLGIVMVATAEDFGREIPLDSLVRNVLPALQSPPPVASAATASAPSIDSSLAFPPKRTAWTQVLSEADAGNHDAPVRAWADTLDARRLDDGSYLVWIRTEFTKPRLEAGRRYDRMVSRFILRCEHPADGRFKRVSTTGFLGDGRVAFQDTVGLAAARAQPWIAASSLDLLIFQRACRSRIGPSSLGNAPGPPLVPARTSRRL